MKYSPQHTQMIATLKQKLQTYIESMDNLILEREEYLDLLDEFPVLSDALEACADDIFYEVKKIKIRTSAIERTLTKLRQSPI